MHQTCKDFIFSAQGAVIIVSKMIRQIYINYNRQKYKTKKRLENYEISISLKNKSFSYNKHKRFDCRKCTEAAINSSITIPSKVHASQDPTKN